MRGLFILLSGAACAAAASPGAIALAFGSDATSSVVVSFGGNSSGAAGSIWLSPAPAIWEEAPAASICAGAPPGAVSIVADAADHSYANAGGLQTVYRARLSTLSPGTSYTYAVCWQGGETSTPRTFTTLATGASPKVVYWGDLGRDGGGQAFPALEAEAAATAARAPGAADFAIAAGDFAYNLCDFSGLRGMEFMERYSNISSYLPVYTVLGNQ